MTNTDLERAMLGLVLLLFMPLWLPGILTWKFTLWLLGNKEVST